VACTFSPARTQTSFAHQIDTCIVAQWTEGRAATGAEASGLTAGRRVESWWRLRVWVCSRNTLLRAQSKHIMEMYKVPMICLPDDMIAADFIFLRAFLTKSGTVILSDKPLPYFYMQFKLTLILLMWRIGWAPNNASRWQMGFNSAFKGNSSDLLNAYNEDYTKKYSTTIFVLNIFCHAHLTTSRTYRTYPNTSHSSP
jgi:hypothetical protein